MWNENGVTKEIEYAILTNEIYKEWPGMNAGEYKEYKGLRKESLRDNMSDLEVVLADIGEITTRELAKKYKPYGLDNNLKIAKEGGKVAKNTRNDIEKRLRESVIKNDNLLKYKYNENKIETK